MARNHCLEQKDKGVGKMSLPFKAVAIDMDGTLLDDQEHYDHSLFGQIFSELNRRGIQVIAASGRPYARLTKDFEKWADKMSFVTLNGARMVKQGREVAGHTLARDDVFTLIKNVQAKYGQIASMIFETDRAYLPSYVHGKVFKFMKYFTGKYEIIDDFDDLPEGNIYQLNFNLESSIAPEIAAAFNKEHKHQVVAFRSAPKAIDINQAGVSKAAGLEELLGNMNISGDELIAFGDSGNDLPMLKFARYSYAMANADDYVKKEAKYLAPANNESGVLKVLQEYLNKD